MLNKVKELVGVELEQEVKLAQATLENGTVIESENFAVGSEVFIVTEDEKVALPIGEYQLEDGEMLTVQEEGIIASIGAAEEPAEEEASKEENLEEEDKEEMKYATKQELAEVKEMIEEIKGMIEKKEEMSEETPQENLSQQSEPVQEEVKEEIEELSKVERVKHNPEKESKKKLNLKESKRLSTTYDRVLSRITNIKN